MRFRLLLKVLVAFVLVMAAAATIYAAIVSTIVSVGTVAFVEELEGPGDLSFVTITFSPGDVSGWHHHPGEVFVVVRSGALTAESACGGTETYAAGQAFIEEPGHIHRAANNSGGTTIIDTLYVVPAGGPRSIAVPAPVCIGPPASTEACMADGWQTFTVPRLFKNQGDCVSWVETGR
jgi:quercetin dioxygenase-like cupin family protein